MDHRRALVALLLPLGACLSNPTPHPESEDASNAQATDTVAPGTDSDDLTNTVDGPDSSAETAADGVDGLDSDVVEPVPTIDLRELFVGDVDGDGYDDVLLGNWIEDQDKWGVHFYYGANGRLGFAFEDGYVNTRARPEGIGRVRLRPDAPADEWDLVVVGTTGTTTTRGWVEIFPMTGKNRGAPYFRETTEFPFIPDSGDAKRPFPIHVAAVDAQLDGVPELVIGDFDDLYRIAPGQWNGGALAAASVLHVEASDQPNYIRKILSLRHGGKDYFALWMEAYKVTYFPYEEDFLEQTTFYLPGTQRDTAVGDFDDDGKPELVGYYDGAVTLIELEPPGAKQFIRIPSYATHDEDFDDIAVGDIDRSGKADIILLNYVPFSWGKSQTVHVIRDPILQPPEPEGDIGEITSNTTTNDPYEFPHPEREADGFYPRRLAVGKFNDRGTEIWVFDQAGQARCIGWDSDDDSLGECGQ